MWVSDDGRINTVAIPEPTAVMTSEFAKATLAAWQGTKPKARRRWLHKLEEGVLAEAVASREVSPHESEFQGVAPPAELLYGNPRSLEELAEALTSVERRWRVDAVMAVSDYLDS